MKDKINKILPDSRIDELAKKKYPKNTDRDLELRSFWKGIVKEARQILIDELEGEGLIKDIETLRSNVDNGKSRWNHKYEDAPDDSQHEMEGYMWALNDIITLVNKPKQ